MSGDILIMMPADELPDHFDVTKDDSLQGQYTQVLIDGAPVGRGIQAWNIEWVDKERGYAIIDLRLVGKVSFESVVKDSELIED